MLCFGHRRGRHLARRSVRMPIHRQAVRVVPEPVQRGRGQQRVARKGLITLAEVQIAGDDGGRALAALGNQLVQVLVRW
jgi:hypothetical protein